MATLMWLTLDIDKYPRLFDEGKQPNTREILRRIGWESEYDRTFRFLSKFVHSSLVNSDFYKKTSEPNSWIDLKDGSYWANALVTENEVLIIETENGFEILEIHQMTEEETNTLYAPYLSMKTFDFIITGIRHLYDPIFLDETCGAAIREFERICSESSDLQKAMIWFAM